MISNYDDFIFESICYINFKQKVMSNKKTGMSYELCSTCGEYDPI